MCLDSNLPAAPSPSGIVYSDEMVDKLLRKVKHFIDLKNITR